MKPYIVLKIKVCHRGWIFWPKTLFLTPYFLLYTDTCSFSFYFPMTKMKSERKWTISLPDLTWNKSPKHLNSASHFHNGFQIFFFHMISLIHFHFQAGGGGPRTLLNIRRNPVQYMPRKIHQNPANSKLLMRCTCEILDAIKSFISCHSHDIWWVHPG